MPPEVSPRTVIDELLAEQRRLTPVERFARKHANAEVPAQARYYSDLIPQSQPHAGQQYAFGVDLDACTGCKACVSACHSLNGLDENEVWRNVGLIHGGTADAPFQQTVTTTCHHCLEPACLEGCPVMAYEKDEATGIVRHLDDQCIGCQYCILKCPYDVPKYSSRLGIVRKCDMCIGRLASCEAPACVQACPHEAIAIRLVDTASVRRESSSGASMLPGAFDSSYTKPTTHFGSRRSIPRNARPADADELRVEHAHWPLIAMLLLTQTAVGLFLVLAVALSKDLSWAAVRMVAIAGCILLHVGLGVSVLHLGRPLGAWRFFLGLRTSWMSREILAFGMFSAAVTFTTAATWLFPNRPLLTLVASTAALLGGLAVFTSAMIYIDTCRPFWSGRLTFARFFGSALLLGSTTAAGIFACLEGEVDPARAAATVAILVCIALFLGGARTFTKATSDAAHRAHQSVRTIRRWLPWIPGARLILFSFSTVAGLIAIVFANPIAAVVLLASTCASQAIERYCFFATCPTPRMPGGVPT